MAVGRLIINHLEEDEDNGMSEDLRSIINKGSSNGVKTTETDFYFRSDSVTSLWKQDNPDGTSFIIASIKGVEYPLVYDEYLFQQLKVMLTKA